LPPSRRSLWQRLLALNDSPLGVGDIPPVLLNADESPAESLGHERRCPDARKGVEDDITRIGCQSDEAVNQGFRRGARVTLYGAGAAPGTPVPVDVMPDVREFAAPVGSRGAASADTGPALTDVGAVGRENRLVERLPALLHRAVIESRRNLPFREIKQAV